MAPYREKKQGTPSSGFPHPLEVTRTTSNSSMNHSLGSVPESPTGSISRNSVLECDYDTNPTVLYQAIEAKQWVIQIEILFQMDGFLHLWACINVSSIIFNIFNNSMDNWDFELQLEPEIGYFDNKWDY